MEILKMEEKIIKVNISDLKPHPENEKIYGENEDISELKESILTEGLSTPLKITDNKVIISGHRRWRSCCQLVIEGHPEFSAVDCIVEHYQSAEAELKDIVLANAHRQKNYEQIAREALTLSEIHRSEAEKRMKSGKKLDPMRNLSQGSTREMTANDLKKAGVKISETNVSCLINAIKSIDSYSANGKMLEATLIQRELHKNVPNYSTISNLTKNMDTLSEKDKQELFDNKTTINKLLKKDTHVQAIKAETPENKKPSNDRINDDYNVGMLFQDELQSLGVHVDVAKSKIEELQRIAGNNQVFSFYPTELINSLKTMIRDMKDNFEYLKIVNSMCDIELIKEIEPITKLEFWKKFGYFNYSTDKLSMKQDKVIFTILRTLALLCDANVWLYLNADERYSYDYNNNAELLRFAREFKIDSNRKMINILNKLYEQFDGIIKKLKDLTKKDLGFFDDCNIPHLIKALDYFNSLEESRILFDDILLELLEPQQRRAFIYVTDDSMEIDEAWVYSEENVEKRQDFLNNLVDEYIENLDDDE